MSAVNGSSYPRPGRPLTRAQMPGVNAARRGLATASPCVTRAQMPGVNAARRGLATARVWVRELMPQGRSSFELLRSTRTGAKELLQPGAKGLLWPGAKGPLRPGAKGLLQPSAKWLTNIGDSGSCKKIHHCLQDTLAGYPLAGYLLAGYPLAGYFLRDTF